MKNFWLTASFLASAPLCMAQSAITITKNDMPALSAGAVHYSVANITGLSSSAGANQAWNFGSASGSAVRIKNLVSAPAFSSTAVQDTTGTEVISGSYGMNAGNVYDIDANGFFFAGSIIKRQSFSLYSVTNNKKDSIIVPSQQYTLRQDLIPFPLNYNDVHKYKTYHTLNFNITASTYFLNNAPAKKIQHTVVIDSVSGWGSITIPSAHKSSIPYPALLVKRRTMNVDSFFLYGAPAPALLLNQFGIKQGDTSYTFTEVFYRKGSLQPIMTINYSDDSTYTSPQSASYAADDVESSIASSGFETGFTAYPNPTTGFINCSFLKASPGLWTINLINTQGQAAASQTIEGTGKTDLHFDVVGAPGLYLLQATDGNGNIIFTGKVQVLK